MATMRKTKINHFVFCIGIKWGLNGFFPFLQESYPPPFEKHRPIMIKDIETIIREALSQYEKGKEAHGDLDLSIDKRDFTLEAEKELLDCINYCAFQILRLRRLRTEN